MICEYIVACKSIERTHCNEKIPKDTVHPDHASTAKWLWGNESHDGNPTANSGNHHGATSHRGTADARRNCPSLENDDGKGKSFCGSIYCPNGNTSQHRSRILPTPSSAGGDRIDHGTNGIAYTSSNRAIHTPVNCARTQSNRTPDHPADRTDTTNAHSRTRAIRNRSPDRARADRIGNAGNYL